MIKLPFLTLSLLVTGACNSQMLSPAVIGGSGSILASNNKSLSFAANNLSLTPSSADSIAGVYDNTKNGNKSGSFAVYPNPAIADLWFMFKLPGQGTVVVSLYNCLGQKIQDICYSNYDNTKVVEKFDVSMLSSGNYLLSLKFTNSKNQVSQVLNRKFQVIN